MAQATAARRSRNSGGAATLEEVRSWPFEFKILPVEELYVDASYQRDLTTFVQRISNAWDPTMVGTLVVNQRDRHNARYAVVDGQTRWSAATEVGVPHLPCIAFVGLTRAQEASLFARLQKERRNMTSFQRFRAELAAGDPQAMAILEIAAEAGYELGHEPGQLRAVAALEHLYRQDATLLERTLRDVREAWADRHLPDREIIRGMGRFLKDNPTCDDERLVRRLKTASPEQLRRRSSALREGTGHGGSSDRYMALAIEAEYTRRGR